MNRDVRRKIEMALRVREFSQAHPFTDPSSAAVLARFDERLTRVETLAIKQRSGQLASVAATARRNQLRDMPLTQLLRHLVHVAEAVGRDGPDLSGKFQLPPQDGSTQAFLVAARAMIQEADAHRDLLIAHGMPESMLKDLGSAMTQFEAASVDANGAKRDRVGASKDLSAVIRELSETIRLLDGLNRYRFRDDTETLSSWENVNQMVAIPVKKAEQPSTPGTTGGDIKTAA